MNLKPFIQLNIKVVLIIMCQLIWPNSALATQAETKKAVVTKTITDEKIYNSVKIHSTLLDEDRELLIHVPEGYDKSEKKYPVIYLLDGKRHFSHARLAESILKGESLMPQSIIVAIPNNRGTRTRDLRSDKDKFLNFINKEVMSYVSNNYRVSEIKTLFGHSLAGYFVLNTLVEHPEIFDNYIAASPVIQVGDSELINKYKILTSQSFKNNKSLYMTITSQNAEGAAATNAMKQFKQLLEQKKL